MDGSYEIKTSNQELSVKQCFRCNIIILSVFIFFTACFKDSEHQNLNIAVNNIGYNIEDEKRALLINLQADSFEVLDAVDNKLTFSGKIDIKHRKDISSGDFVDIIDFTNLNNPGSYYIRTKKDTSVKSTVFSIGEDRYEQVTLLALQSFYYNRCGTHIDNGTNWTHTACHTNRTQYYNNIEKNRDVRGGWHDAGDYSRITVNTALSASLLLYLYSEKPESFYDGQLNIPKSDNNIPDVLDEVTWALRWLTKMQKSDGSVYHKVSSKKWIGEFLPQNDPGPLFIFRPSSNATAAFAAVAALASRLMKEYDPKFASELQSRSLKAWDYLAKNPVSVPLGGFKNPPDVKGGEYGSNQDIDTRMWASIELFRSTQKAKILDYFIINLDNLVKGDYDLKPVSWANFHNLALSSFLDSKIEMPIHIESASYNKVLEIYQKHSERLIAVYNQNSYSNLLKPNEYYWGSNSVNMAYAFDLIQMYKHTGNKKYKNIARDQLHYVLGRNPLGLTFITGIGKHSVQNPYHQFSMLDGSDKPLPGMLVGGPNDRIDRNRWGKKISDYPAKSFEDKALNFRVSEPAINYTSIFIYVAGYFSFTNNQVLSEN